MEGDSKTDHDGVEEKMLPSEDAKLVQKETEIKFLPDDKKNGDAKIDICELKTAFVGMGKEELMRYANDPFWVRLRWILFIAFWLVWLLMLVGAIAIIIAAPKCSAPKPLSWWEQGPLAEIDLQTTDEALLKQVKDDGFQGVIVAPNTKDDSYALVDDSILRSIIAKGLKIIIDLNPVNSLQWFNASENLQEPYANYYIWKKGSQTNGAEQPPNNWLSPLGGSAWKYSQTRKEFYLAQMGKPDLNFRNTNVIEEFSKVVRSWLKAGANGIRLANIYRLLVDQQFRNENFGSQPGYTLENYGFYTHTHATNQEDIGDVLVQWRKIVLNMTNNEGILTLLDDIDILTPYTLNDTVLVDIPRHTEVFNWRKHNTSAVHLYKGLESTMSVLGKKVRPSWKYQTGPKDIPEDVLQIVTFLLPGTPIVNVTSHNTSSPILKTLVQLRALPVVLFGNFTKFQLSNNTIFGYSREKSGQPGYLVLFNPTANNTVVDVSQIPNMSEDLTVTLVSSNYNDPTVKPKSKVGSKEVKLTAKSAIILTYVRADATE